MTKSLVVSIVALLLSVTVGASRPLILDSIHPLRWPSQSGDILTLKTHCTTSEYGTHYELTAFHCIAKWDEEENEPTDQADMDRGYYVGNMKATVYDWDAPNDLALLTTKEANRHPLKLTDHVEYGEHIESAGYAEGWTTPTFIAGVLGNPLLKTDWRGDPEAIYVFSVCPGHSGSPVVDIHNHVMGVIQAGPNEGCSALGIGPSFDVLRRFLVEKAVEK